MERIKIPFLKCQLFVEPLKLTIFLQLISLTFLTVGSNFSEISLTKISHFSERLQPLIQNIVGQFNDCEHIYIEQSHYSSKFSEGNKSLNMSLELKNSFRYFNLEHISKLSGGLHQVSIGFNITFPRHKDIHRFGRKQCGIGIIILNSFTDQAETWLVEAVIPRYGPILRKDLDHFLVIAPDERTSDAVLLSPKFGSKIKYKLGLFSASHKTSSKILSKTVDLYGNNGLPKLRELVAFKGNDFQQNLDFFPDTTKYFNGKAFRFAIPKVAFRFEIEMKADGRYHPKRGFYKWWLDEAMLKFNFTYDIFRASFGGGTGKRLKNGTWVGATGDLYYGKADCSFIVGEIYSRHKFLGWSSSLSYEWVVFVTHSPKKSYSPKALFWPFSLQMWGLFLVSMILVTFSMKAVAQASFDLGDVQVTGGGGGSTMNWGYLKMFEYLFSTLMEQDKKGPFWSSSIRVLGAYWLLFAIVTVTAYKGKLVSLIAFPVNKWVPTTFQELADSDFKVALNVVGKAGAAYVLIASSPSPIFQKLAERMELIPEAEVCLQRAMTENLGCIVWKGIADYAAVKNLTDKNGRVPLQESSQIALFIGDGLVYERRAIFGEHLDRTIQAVVQMGLTIKWFQLDQQFIVRERKIYEKSRNITKPIYDYDDGGPKKLLVSQFTGLFLLCLFGIIISSGGFVVELFWHRHRRGRGSIAKQNSGEGGTTSVNDGSSSSPAIRKWDVKQALFQNNIPSYNFVITSLAGPTGSYTT